VLYFSHYLLHNDQFFCWISDRYCICAVWSNRVHKVSSRTSPGGHHYAKLSFHCIMQLYNTLLLLLLLSFFFFLSFLMPTKLDFLHKSLILKRIKECYVEQLHIFVYPTSIMLYDQTWSKLKITQKEIISLWLAIPNIQRGTKMQF